VVGGMAAWLVSFVAVGFLVVPVMYRVAGLNIFELEPSDKALFTFVCQVAETVVSLSLVRLLTFKALDEAPEKDRSTFFNYSLKGPFKAPTGWVTWAAIGVALSPLVVGTVATLLTTVGYEESVGGRGTVDGVASMIQMDLASYLSLLSVTSVMAPVLEETVFRGFLLTSLTRCAPCRCVSNACVLELGSPAVVEKLQLVADVCAAAAVVLAGGLPRGWPSPPAARVLLWRTCLFEISQFCLRLVACSARSMSAAETCWRLSLFMAHGTARC